MESNMATCDWCGASFSPQVPGWGTTCGGCIANALEISLMGTLPTGERKPMRRASGDASSVDNSVEESGRQAEPRRSA
jgi:hypothetical protein